MRTSEGNHCLKNLGADVVIDRSDHPYPTKINTSGDRLFVLPSLRTMYALIEGQTRDSTTLRRRRYASGDKIGSPWSETSLPYCKQDHIRHNDTILLFKPMIGNQNIKPNEIYPMPADICVSLSQWKPVQEWDFKSISLANVLPHLLQM